MLEESTYRLGVGRRIGIEHGHAVQRGCHLFRASYNLIGHLEKPAGRCTAALGHDEPLTDARRENNAAREERYPCAR